MYHAIVFLPLLGFLIAGLFGRMIGPRPSEVVTTALLFIAAALSWVAFLDVGFGNGATRVQLMTWMQSGGLVVDWALRIDTLTAVMLVVVNTVSALVHLYSIGYMHEDEHRPRFFAYLSLFTFAMLMLVTSDNLVQMFFGWEGVGLASYLLIGFWFKKPSANAAAIKAFVVNRVGDFGFALGIFLVFWLTGSVAYDQVFAKIPEIATTTFHFLGYDWNAVTLICLLLFMGAMGKSAQFLLHTWLPDAMEGPTPVSALIHAATMVTAGVFLMARMSPVMEHAPFALAVVCVVGATTAFFAATVGCVQNDIKRIIAYSTCSQLGYMFFAVGVGAYQAAVFHLITHAFFKALLFLGAGSVIHAMSDEQDIRKMGGIWRKIPVTYAMMWIGSLALAGIPWFAGYYSKDFVLEAAYAAGTPQGMYAFVLGLLAALLTAFYSWRLIILAFHGTPRADHHTMQHVHESPWVMLAPLLVLAAGALFAGSLLKYPFVGPGWETFWQGSIVNAPHNHIIEAVHHVPAWVPVVPTIVAAAGIATAYLFYMFVPGIPARLAAAAPALHRFLLHKWYFDELYDRLFVRPARRLAQILWRTGDVRIIDGMPNGAASLAAGAARGTVRFQTGRVANYALTMIGGLVLFATLLLLGVGR